jgi:hypothetical protein
MSFFLPILRAHVKIISPSAPNIILAKNVLFFSV